MSDVENVLTAEQPTFESSEEMPSGPAPEYDALTQFILDAILGPNVAHAAVSRETDRLVVMIESEPELIGKIVGKGGRTISSIRSVVRAAGLRHKDRVFVEIADD